MTTTATLLSTNKRSIVKFVTNNYGWTFNLIGTHCMFWIVGFPLVLKYGYSDTEYNSVGGIPSGPSGSGAFIVTLFICVLCTCIYLALLISYFTCDEDETKE